MMAVVEMRSLHYRTSDEMLRCSPLDIPEWPKVNHFRVNDLLRSFKSRQIKIICYCELQYQFQRRHLVSPAVAN